MSKEDLQQVWLTTAKKHALSNMPPKSVYVFHAESINLQELGLQLECLEGKGKTKAGKLSPNISSTLRSFEQGVSRSVLTLGSASAETHY